MSLASILRMPQSSHLAVKQLPGISGALGSIPSAAMPTKLIREGRDGGWERGNETIWGLARGSASRVGEGRGEGNR